MIHPSRVTILLPTRHRPDLLRRVLDSIRETAPKASLVVALDPDDTQGHVIAAKRQYHAIVATCEDNNQGCHSAWNTALAHAPADALAFVSGADDVIFRPLWLEYSLAMLDTMCDSGVVGFNDDFKQYDRYTHPYTSHYIMTRDFIVNHMGGVFCPPVFRNECADLWVCAVANKAGKFSYCDEAYVSHEWRKDGMDETYIIAERHRDECRRIYYQLESAGFPVTWKAIIK
jgi:glycosyltransferase involved in cell wall biosynthesis